MTYKGEHNHKKPEVNQNSVVGTSRNKSSETRLCIGKEVGSFPNIRNLDSPNVGKMGSPNMLLLQFDEPDSSNSHIFTGESEVPYTSMEFIGGSDDDDILIPNMTPMLEDFLLDFNHINNGALFP